MRRRETRGPRGSGGCVRDPRRVRAQEPGARRRPARAARRARPVARRRLPHRQAPPRVGLRRGGRDPADAADHAGARRAALDARRGQRPRQPAADRRPQAVPRRRAHRAARRPARADRAPAGRRRRGAPSTNCSASAASTTSRTCRPTTLSGQRTGRRPLRAFRRPRLPPAADAFVGDLQPRTGWPARPNSDKPRPDRPQPRRRARGSRSHHEHCDGLCRRQEPQPGHQLLAGRAGASRCWSSALNTGYATWKAARLGGASTAASSLQVHSQQLANQGREAVGGNARGVHRVQGDQGADRRRRRAAQQPLRRRPPASPARSRR